MPIITLAEALDHLQRDADDAYGGVQTTVDGVNAVIETYCNRTFAVTTNDALIRVAHVHDPFDITATWTDVSGGSACEYSTDISAITGRPTHY